MFFKTQIKKVNQYGVIDMTGRPLAFIGYLPVKEGDFVFTDGRFIFGNAPPKGSENIPDEPSGIPVLTNEQRGYFSLNAAFKIFSVFNDNWIFNSEKNFRHGSAELIDADIALDENSNDIGYYTVEKKINQIATDDDFFIFYADNSEQKLFFSLIDSDYIISDDNLIQDFELIIYKDGKESDKINFKKFFSDVEAEAKADVNIQFLARDSENHIKSRASLINFKIKPDGNWEALIQIEVFAAKTFEGKRTVLNYDIQTIPVYQTFFRAPDPDTFLEYGQWGAVGYSFLKRLSQVLPATPITIGGMGVVIVGNVFALTEPPTFSEQSAGLSSTVSHIEKLLKISSDDEAQIIFERKKIIPLIFSDFVQEWLDDSKFLQKNPDGSFSLSKPIEEMPALRGFDDSVFPKISLNDYRIACTGHLLEIRPIVIMTLSVTDDTRTFSFIPEWQYRYDSSNLPDAPEEILNIADSFSFYVQDDFHATFKNLNDDINSWQLVGIFDKNGQKIIGEIESLDAHKWNISFAELKGKKFLLGIHEDKIRDLDGKIFKIDNGNFEVFDSGLKNFRLRELKKISKSSF